MAQDVLFHLPRPHARAAFENLTGALKPGGALFVNVMNIDILIDLTKKLKLEPPDHLVEEIHNDALSAATLDDNLGLAGISHSDIDFLRFGSMARSGG